MINNQTDEDIDVEFNMNNILNEENENMKFMDKSNESIKEQSYLYKNVTFAEETFDRFLRGISHVKIEEQWLTGDVRPGRESEQWLNLILRKV